MTLNDRLKEIRAQIKSLEEEEQDIKATFKRRYSACKFYGKGKPISYARCANSENELGWCGVTCCPLEYWEVMH